MSASSDADSDPANSRYVELAPTVLDKFDHLRRNTSANVTLAIWTSICPRDQAMKIVRAMRKCGIETVDKMMTLEIDGKIKEKHVRGLNNLLNSCKDHPEQQEISARFFHSSSMWLGLVETISIICSQEVKYNGMFVLFLVNDKDFYKALMAETAILLRKTEKLLDYGNGQTFMWTFTRPDFAEDGKPTIAQFRLVRNGNFRIIEFYYANHRITEPLADVLLKFPASKYTCELQLKPVLVELQQEAKKQTTYSDGKIQRQVAPTHPVLV